MMYSIFAALRPSQSLRRFAQVLLLIAVSVAPPAMAAATPPAMTIMGVQVTDVREGSLVMSWTTSEQSNGRARCYDASGLSLVAQVDDPVGSTSTHYVTITGLNPNTQYLCEVESVGVIANNQGLRYPVTTGPVLSTSPVGHLVYGVVYKSGGVTIAPNTMAYLRLIDANGLGSSGQSQWVSARIDSDGYWFFSLENVRTATAAQYFVYTPGSDLIEVWVNGGLDGSWGLPLLPEQVLVIPGTFPAPMPHAVLNGIPLAVTLANFEAIVEDNGVLLTWETTSEIDNQGFNLYRALDIAGPHDLLVFIPSQAPGSSQGFVYEWLDTDVVSGQTYYYWLEAVDLAGNTTLHGPISATYQSPTSVNVATFAAPTVDSSPLGPWVLALPAMLGGAAYGLRRRSRR